MHDFHSRIDFQKPQFKCDFKFIVTKTLKNLDTGPVSFSNISQFSFYPISTHFNQFLIISKPFHTMNLCKIITSACKLIPQI